MFQVSHKLHHWQIAVICKLRMHWLPRPERSECSNSKITRNSVHWSCSRGNQWVTNQSSDDGRGDCNYVWVLIIVIPTITTSIMNVFLLIASRLPNLGNTCYLNACLQVFFHLPFFMRDLETISHEFLAQPICSLKEAVLAYDRDEQKINGYLKWVCFRSSNTFSFLSFFKPPV